MVGALFPQKWLCALNWHLINLRQIIGFDCKMLMTFGRFASVNLHCRFARMSLYHQLKLTIDS